MLLKGSVGQESDGEFADVAESRPEQLGTHFVFARIRRN